MRDILYHNKENLLFLDGSEETVGTLQQGNEIIGFLLNILTLVVK